MQCPKCGFDQPEGAVECLSCGVVFEKLRDQTTQPPPPPPPPDDAQAAEEVAAIELVGGPHDSLSEPIGGPARAVRVVAALGCIGIGLLLYLNGAAQHSFYPFAILVLYVAAGLYGLSSMGAPITLRRFAWEMLALVGATIILRVAFPAVFSMDASGFSHIPPRPLEDPQVVFLNEVERYLKDANGLVEASVANDDEAVTARLDSLSPAGVAESFVRIPKDKRRRFISLNVGVKAAERLLVPHREARKKPLDEGAEPPLVSLTPQERDGLAVIVGRLDLMLSQVRAALTLEGPGTEKGAEPSPAVP